MENKYTEALSNWTALNEHINEFTLEELEMLLDFEFQGENRGTFVKRIHQRLVRLRGSAERAKLMKGR